MGVEEGGVKEGEVSASKIFIPVPQLQILDRVCQCLRQTLTLLFNPFLLLKSLPRSHLYLKTPPALNTTTRKARVAKFCSNGKAQAKHILT